MEPEFNAVAHAYDAMFSFSSVGKMLRNRVWAILEGLNRTRSRVWDINPPLSSQNQLLELNCGTGEDAIWFASKGWNVLATDISDEMIAVARAKAIQWKIANSAEDPVCKGKLRFQTCSFAALGQLPEHDFDLIFSNFGGLNCISAQDLEILGEVVAHKLKPRGKFVAVVMGRFCLWETVYFLLKMKPRQAFRRFNKSATHAALDADHSVPTWYYSPSALRTCLETKTIQTNAKAFKYTVAPIGFWLPPSYLNPFFEKHPRFLRLLNYLEKSVAPSFLSMAADHFLICLETPTDFKR